MLRRSQPEPGEETDGMVVAEGRHTDAEEKPGQRQGKCPEREVASWLEENCVGVKPPCDQARIGSGVDPECG